MAEKKVYYNSTGPYFYEDTDLIDDQDGDFAGLTHYSLITQGQIYVATVPTVPEEIVRLDDLSTINGQFVLGLETATAGLRRFPAARQMTNDEDRFRYHFMMGC